MTDARKRLRPPSGASRTYFASNTEMVTANRYRSCCEAIRRSNPAYFLASGIMPRVLERLVKQQQETAETN